MPQGHPADTANRKNAHTDRHTGTRTMSPRIASAVLLLTLTISAVAQETATTEVSRPLNLSLPRDAVWSFNGSPGSGQFRTSQQQCEQPA